MAGRPPSPIGSVHPSEGSSSGRSGRGGSEAGAWRPHRALWGASPATSSRSDDDAASITSSQFSTLFTFSDGRRFHNLESAAYAYPNDEEELDRLEYQHIAYKHLLGSNFIPEVSQLRVPRRGERNPSSREAGPRAILDLGCGSGIWAIEVAETFPQAEVIGVDLCPVQPDFVPPNLSFYSEDFMQGPLDYISNEMGRGFDLIHVRCLLWGIQDWPLLFSRIADALLPGGMVLLVEPGTPKRRHHDELRSRSGPSVEGARSSRDESRRSTSITAPTEEEEEKNKKMATIIWWTALKTCMRKKGLDPDIGSKLEQYLENNGNFSNIQCRVAECPLGSWVSDPDLAIAGKYLLKDSIGGLSTTKPLFLQAGYSEAWTSMLNIQCQEEWKKAQTDPSARCWWPSYVVHATRKP